MRYFKGLCLMALLALAGTSAGAELVEGRDYERLAEVQPPQGPVRVEVVEFFSYACPHCYQMHPLIQAWAERLPKEVTLVRIPVSLGRREWGSLVRAYYALQATGDLHRLDTALFEAIHNEQKQLFDERSITAWVTAHGVDAAKFGAAYNSFGVTAKASRAEQASRDYHISGVPFVAVGGKYVARGRTYEDMLDVARQLVDKALAAH